MIRRLHFAERNLNRRRERLPRQKATRAILCFFAHRSLRVTFRRGANCVKSSAPSPSEVPFASNIKEGGILRDITLVSLELAALMPTNNDHYRAGHLGPNQTLHLPTCNHDPRPYANRFFSLASPLSPFRSTRVRYRGIIAMQSKSMANNVPRGSLVLLSTPKSVLKGHTHTPDLGRSLQMEVY